MEDPLVGTVVLRYLIGSSGLVPLTDSELPEVQELVESFPLTPLPLKPRLEGGVMVARFVNQVDAKKFHQFVRGKGYAVSPRIVLHSGAYEVSVYSKLSSVAK